MDTAQKFQQAATILMETPGADESPLKNLSDLIRAYSPPGVVVLTLDDYPAQLVDEMQGERVAGVPAGIFMGYEDFSVSVVCFTTKGVHISTPAINTQEGLMQLMNSLSPVSSVVEDALVRLSK